MTEASESRGTTASIHCIYTSSVYPDVSGRLSLPGLSHAHLFLSLRRLTFLLQGTVIPLMNFSITCNLNRTVCFDGGKEGRR